MEWKYDICSEAGRRICERAGSLLSEKYLADGQILQKSMLPSAIAQNLINWGMLPLLTDEKEEQLSFHNGDYIFFPDILEKIKQKENKITAYIVKDDLVEVTFRLGEMTENEREIIQKGCLINYYRDQNR